MCDGRTRGDEDMGHVAGAEWPVGDEAIAAGSGSDGGPGDPIPHPAAPVEPHLRRWILIQPFSQSGGG